MSDVTHAQDAKVATHGFPEEMFVELTPQGVVMGPVENRPILLLRSEKGDSVLPVWLNEIQTPIVLAELGHNGGFHRAHTLTLKILKTLGGKILRCVFVELSGVHQFVEIYVARHRGSEFVERVRADEAMGLVFAHKAKIFATREFIESCRSLQIDSRDLGISPELYESIPKSSPGLLQ